MILIGYVQGYPSSLRQSAVIANGHIPQHFTDSVAVWISTSRRQRKATTVIVHALLYAVVNKLWSITVITGWSLPAYSLDSYIVTSDW